MKRKALVVYNPASGRLKSEKILEKLIPELRKSGIAYHLLETQAGESTPASIDFKIDQTFTDVIAVGGDGTLNHTLNGIKNYNVVFNIISAGSGNDFVKNINIGRTIDDQIKTIIDGSVMRVDVGQCNEQLFLNGVGLGFDGQIVSDMLHKKSWLKGHLKYYYHVLKILATFKTIPLKYGIHGRQYDKHTLLLVAANGTTFGGGFKLTPDARISDGFLDVCSIGNISPINRFLNIHKLSKGTHRSMEQVHFDKIKSIRIEGNPLIVGHIDGEFLGSPPFDIKVLPGFLKLRVK
ncbi:diacylglycerol kinase family protein [Reichenbachiella sp. MALMAid0571]|uniref:diacylglycerol/lipid kinase family protein n=1 Tax=Reichenbachiella sp. MALMAid0571 TaxID=3143939 RepID=UPI0032DF7AF5